MKGPIAPSIAYLLSALSLELKVPLEGQEDLVRRRPAQNTNPRSEAEKSGPNWSFLTGLGLKTPHVYPH